ncbi:MAG TPA: polyprenol monophosphomannose synthase [Nitrososphaerales archaeon]|nr:polyprenol monophosphomannose synthase [Nitrososphaerales archaeon]
MARVCVVIPTYNERENIGPLLEGIRASRDGADLLFVDDSSPDGTPAEISRYANEEGWIHLLSRGSKMGIGSAYLDGFRHAVTMIGAETVVEMDADLQHPPSLIPKLVAAVSGGADVAVASRYVEGGGSEGWGLGRRTISRSANWLAKTLLGLKVGDCTSGFRAYGRASVQKLLESNLPTSGFEFQVAALKTLKGQRIVEVPYTFRARAAGESKLKFRDVVRFFFYLLSA